MQMCRNSVYMEDKWRILTGSDTTIAKVVKAKGRDFPASHSERTLCVMAINLSFNWPLNSQEEQDFGPGGSHP